MNILYHLGIVKGWASTQQMPGDVVISLEELRKAISLQ